MSIDIISRIIVAILMVPAVYVGIRQFRERRDLLLKAGFLLTSLGWMTYAVITAYGLNYFHTHGQPLGWLATTTGFIALLMALIHLFNYFGDKIVSIIKRIK